MKVLHDYVVIKRDENEETTKSGLLLAEKIKALPPTGVVKEIGFDVWRVKPGDHVVYKVYASVDIEVEGESYDVLPAEGVMAILL
jgi:chaperonin GroES